MIDHHTAIQCDECEGSGHHAVWGINHDGSEGLWLDPTTPCPYCQGAGRILIPTFALELEDLTPLIPKD